MIRAVYTTVLGVFSAAAAWPQAPAFEVASIKPAAPMEQGKMRIGFGGDAGRINYTNVTLKDVIARAYGVKPFQVSGPSWMESERYDITAKIPDGVPGSKVPEMLQSLLIERFKMTVRKENKEQSIYALVIGRNGPKLKASEDGAPGPAMVGPDGAKVNAPKGAMMVDGTGRIQANGATMSGFADMLSRLMDRPVIDMTGLDGKYDLTLEVAMEDLIGMKRMAGGMPAAHAGGEGGPAPEGNPRASMFSAVQQLGLKLDPRKAPVDLIVVESAEKVATEN
ncbi:MAG TPA: TIGR03435 family protein [Candidatus Acidoferrales bacterium]|nr:TIGR03435 family protein [Candidatus Acidoferrales bacterium]